MKKSFLFSLFGLALLLSSCMQYSTFTHPVTDPKPLMACDCDDTEDLRDQNSDPKDGILFEGHPGWITPLTPH